MRTRIGPDHLPPDLAVDGIVVQSWLVNRDGSVRFVRQDHLTPEVDPAQQVMMAFKAYDHCQAMAGDGDEVICIVAYDGDSGERINAMQRWL